MRNARELGLFEAGNVRVSTRDITDSITQCSFKLAVSAWTGLHQVYLPEAS